MGKQETFIPVRIITRGGEGEIIEKKSRFIATVRPVANEQEAVSFVEEMKKKYWDARHNCYAYVVGDRNEIIKSSDDGEPGGTAGRPMLEVLQGEGLHNAAVVVTRYFGGVLLGTGGLVRAYSKAVKAGLEASETAWKRWGVRISVTVAYTEAGRVQYLLGKESITPEHTEYTDNVTFLIVLPAEQEAGMKKELTEAAGGRLSWRELERPVFLIDKNITI